LFFMYMMVVKELSEKPERCPGKKFPKNPLMLAVCPTNYIEEQTVRSCCLRRSFLKTKDGGAICRLWCYGGLNRVEWEVIGQILGRGSSIVCCRSEE
jgi:hypothetical protein